MINSNAVVKNNIEKPHVSFTYFHQWQHLEKLEYLYHNKDIDIDKNQDTEHFHYHKDSSCCSFVITSLSLSLILHTTPLIPGNLFISIFFKFQGCYINIIICNLLGIVFSHSIILCRLTQVVSLYIVHFKIFE